MAPVSLQQIVERNYDKLTYTEDIQPVITYLSTHDIGEITKWGLLFLKQLTKVASHIYTSHPYSLDGKLEKLYELNIRGARIIEDKGVREYSEERIANMHSHFYAHAGDAAKVLFETTSNIEWNKTAIDCYNRFLEYYNSNYDPRMRKVISKIKSNVADLMEQVNA